MPRRWQYPSWAVIDRDALTRPEVTTPDKWWRPFSEPVLQHAGKLAFAALIVSGGLFQGDPGDFVEQEVVTVDKWFQPASEPIRVKSRLHAALSPSTWDDSDLLTRPEEPQLDKWFSPFSEPVLVQKPLPIANYPSSWDDPDALTRPELISLDKWYQAFSEPDKTARRITVSFGEFRTELEITAEEDITLDKWYQPFSEFLYALPRSGADLDSSGITYIGEPSDAEPLAELLGWFVNLSEPTLPKVRVAEFPSLSIDSDALTRPETTTLDRWWKPLEEPVRTKVISHAALYASGLTYIGEPRDTEPLAEELGWFTTLGEPVRVKKPLAIGAYPSFVTDSDSLTQPEITSLDKWYVPLSEFLHKDVRSEAALLAGNNYEGEPADFEPTAELLGWYEPLSKFIYKTKRTDAALYPYFWIDDDLLTRPEETLVSKWVPQTSEPVRVKPRLLTALQEAFFVDANIAAIPPEEEITLDKWYQPHSEPVLVKSRASDFPSHTNDTEGLTLPEVTSLDRWWAAASEPLRVKQPLNVSFGEFRTELEIVVPEVITLDKWYSPHSEPDKTKKRASEFPHFVIDPEALTLPEVTTPDKWYRNLDEPVRVQSRSLAGLLSGAVYEGEPTDVEPLAEFMGWFKSLDEPVLPIVLPVALYPTVSYQDEISELDPTAERLAWFEGLSTPTLPKPRVAEFPSYVIDSDALTQPETTSLDKWFVELSEPLRTKSPLPVGAVPTLVESLEPIITLILGWDVPLSEPIFIIDPTTPLKPSFFIDPEALTLPEVTTLDKWFTPLSEPVRIGDRLVVPRLPAAVGFKLPITIIVPIKSFTSKEADQTHISKEADQTHISKEAGQTKDNPRC